MDVFNLFVIPISALFYLALRLFVVGLLISQCVRVVGLSVSSEEKWDGDLACFFFFSYFILFF